MIPYRIPVCANTPYRPSNGTEGEMFMSEFCDRCAKATPTGGCTLGISIDVWTGKERAEWTHTAEGEPTCTAFAEVHDVPI